MSRPAKGPAKLVPKPVRLDEHGHALVAKAAKLKGVTPAEFRRNAVLEAAQTEIACAYHAERNWKPFWEGSLNG